jgi:hypothetical protein
MALGTKPGWALPSPSVPEVGIVLHARAFTRVKGWLLPGVSLAFVDNA